MSYAFYQSLPLLSIFKSVNTQYNKRATVGWGLGQESRPSIFSDQNIHKINKFIGLLCRTLLKISWIKLKTFFYKTIKPKSFFPPWSPTIYRPPSLCKIPISATDMCPCMLAKAYSTDLDWYIDFCNRILALELLKKLLIPVT